MLGGLFTKVNALARSSAVTLNYEKAIVGIALCWLRDRP